MQSDQSSPSVDAFGPCESRERGARTAQLIRSRGYKTFFMLSSAEHEFSSANK